jgi:hypothetical protein
MKTLIVSADTLILPGGSAPAKLRKNAGAHYETAEASRAACSEPVTVSGFPEWLRDGLRRTLRQRIRALIIDWRLP